MTEQPDLPGTKSAPQKGGLGSKFEGELNFVHEFYLMKGIVDVVKNPVEWAYGGNAKKHDAVTPQGRYLVRKKSNVDYSGGNDRGTYIFDAKETKDNYFPFSSITDEQVTRLKQSAKCRTRSGVMINFTTLDRVFFVPIAHFLPRYENWKKQAGRAKPGTASLSVEDCERIGVEVFRDRIAGFWDWYRAIGNG